MGQHREDDGSSVAFQDTHEQPMGNGLHVAIVGDLPGLQLRAGDVRMDQWTWRTIRLEPVDTLQVSESRAGRPPAIPLALHDDRRSLAYGQSMILIRAGLHQGPVRYDAGLRTRHAYSRRHPGYDVHPPFGGLTHRPRGNQGAAFVCGYTISPFLTAYRTISAVLWRFSFCIRFFRWVSTVDSPRSSKFATSLFERPSASN